MNAPAPAPTIPPVSYRLGLAIVLGTILASLATILAASALPARTQTRAGQSLGDQSFPLGPFHLVDQSGRPVTDADLADDVAIASFIFTRCPLSCPKITSVMKGLQGKLAGTSVRLLSLTVDPDHDTPAVLDAYARRFDADPARWTFLTGPKADVLALIRDRLKLGVQVNDDPAVASGSAEAFSHSDRLALIDRGRVVGYFDSTDPTALATLLSDARDRAPKLAPPWVLRLPAVNAVLNGTCALLLLLGWSFILRQNARAHAATMIAAVTVSALFLACYLLYHYHVGSVRYRGVGPLRVTYLTILLSHTLLATFGVVPLVTLTLLRAYHRQFHRHRRIASLTFPIWLYVSVTGVVIYLMLYQLPVPTS